MFKNMPACKEFHGIIWIKEDTVCIPTFYELGSCLLGIPPDRLHNGRKFAEHNAHKERTLTLSAVASGFESSMPSSLRCSARTSA